jgi:hypothetical protein
LEGYTGRDVLIVMRLDFAEALQQIEHELAELDETLEFSGIAEHLLRDDPALNDHPAIKRWLETVSNRADLERDREELILERDELTTALQHLEQRLTGKRIV